MKAGRLCIELLVREQADRGGFLAVAGRLFLSLFRRTRCSSSFAVALRRGERRRGERGEIGARADLQRDNERSGSLSSQS